MANEPGLAILTVFSQLIDRIKSSRPVRTDGKALTTGFVYSQLVLGEMVDPKDYANAWSPMGGSSLQDDVKAANGGGASVYFSHSDCGWNYDYSIIERGDFFRKQACRSKISASNSSRLPDGPISRQETDGH
ncbi:hypothetical protein [Spirosoma foliorum]|uniref:Uncharacterized protein n=1 Tax=Spirosoma foliorum TaxID=2710596 RepID=A0A7G5GS91_9BACT|nr:hypothetical protein [Spirosoma foliorum]QMW01733.1 hypothetical protein H3H32_27870 [Spirosoma foliorum]